MTTPLLARWRIRADELPDRLLNMDRPAPAFTLPGAASLRGFADLLGEEDDQPAARPMDEDAPFPLPAMIPEDVSASAELFLDIDFGALPGDRAVLTFDEICGSGEIFLGDQAIAAFGKSAAEQAENAARLTAAPCALAVDLTEALRLGRKEQLRVRFDDKRPAGIPGAVFLKTTRGGWLSDLSVLPAAAPHTMTVSARIHADKEGRYILRVTPQPQKPGLPIPPAREVSYTLNPRESRACQLAFSMPGDAFTPGVPHRGEAMRAELFYMEGKAALPCDSALIAAGYVGRPADCFIPLDSSDLAGDCETLTARLAALHVGAVSLDAPAADCFYLAAARAGLGVNQYLPAGHPQAARLMRHPCVSLNAQPIPPASAQSAVTAWQLCGVTGMSRMPDPDLTPADLLFEAAGRVLHPADEGVTAVLSWLGAVAIRLRAEAARQGRFAGALCAEGQWMQEDIAAAIRTAFAPMHLSALPLLGAWWTGTRFSAALEAFVPENIAEQPGMITACAVLEDDEGHELARVERPFIPRRNGRGAPLGVIDAALPDHPCVLTLTCRLMRGETVLEESTLPVYVGLRGPLEAAF